MIREDIEVKAALQSKLDALEEDLSDLLEARTDEAEVLKPHHHHNHHQLAD